MDVDQLPPLLRRALRAPRRITRILLSKTPFAYQNFLQGRKAIAAQFLRGEGIEIGALQNPLEVPENVRVRYVDRLNEKDLVAHYPEMASQRLVPIDIVDDGEFLRTLDKASVDFVIANHMLEHCEDPIGTLKTFLRVVRPGGIIFLAIPDKRFTFDKKRDITPLEHFARDYREGPSWSRHSHYLEWTSKTMRISEQEFESKALELMKNSMSIHFHVWTTKHFDTFLRWAKVEFSLPYDICLLKRNEYETVAILTAS